MKSDPEHVRRLLVFLGAVVVLLLQPAAVRGQQAVVQGQVVDGGSLEPVEGAQVFVVGGEAGAITADDGRYRVTGILSGPGMPPSI